MTEVILLEKIKKLGDIGDIKKVKNGFARNFLIPRKKVLRANASNKATFQNKKAELEKINVEKKVEAEKVASKISSITITVIRQAGSEGRLFGSVSSHDIAKGVSDSIPDVDVSSNCIEITDKIKSIGIYKVNIELHPDVLTSVLINVARNKEEAEAALKLKNDEEKKESVKSALTPVKERSDKEINSADLSLDHEG